MEHPNIRSTGLDSYNERIDSEMPQEEHTFLYLSMTLFRQIANKIPYLKQKEDATLVCHVNGRRP